MSWYNTGIADRKVLVCDYCGDEVDADDIPVAWVGNGDGLHFCSQGCAAELGIDGAPVDPEAPTTGRKTP